MKKNRNKIGAFQKLKSINLDIPIHPFLFAVYPILFIYSSNLTDVFLAEIFMPIIISLVATTFIFFALKFVLKDKNKAAVITTVVLIIFFSYGHVFSLIENFKIGGAIIGRNRYLLPSSLIILALISFITLKTKLNLNRVSKILNVVALVLILASLGAIGNYAFAHRGLSISEKEVEKASETSTKNQASSKLPDIYYIILDGYARQSTLKKVHKFDNNEFINYLKKKGFYVAPRSQSNYSITQASLPSSLNMTYLDDIANSSFDERGKREKAIEMTRNNEVAKFLRGKGYTIVNIGTTWGVTKENPYADKVFALKDRSDFTRILYETSALMLLERSSETLADSILFGFKKLSEIPDMQEPTFTFTHIVSPHPPYLFDQYGNKTLVNIKDLGREHSWFQREKYVNQLIFINERTMEAVDNILAKSKTAPIIIIQGDHGTGPIGTPEATLTKERVDERMDILNAYYLPNGGNKTLYETITPVNSFRKVLNYYFKAKYKILEDKSYFSHYSSYFRFIPVHSEKDNSISP